MKSHEVVGAILCFLTGFPLGFIFFAFLEGKDIQYGIDLFIKWINGNLDQ